MFDASAVVTCDADLEAAVGARPGATLLKSIRFLDEHCRQLLAHSPCTLIGTTTADGALQAMVACGDPGRATPRSDTLLDLGPTPVARLVDGAPVGLLALVPGYGETLRVNGRLQVDDRSATLAVEEAFLHCAKAIVRSDLWTAGAASDPAVDAQEPPTVEAFLTEARFAVLASIDAEGHADLSPRGDPAGLIRRIAPGTIAIAERPGNRRTDTLHNLVDDPRVALLALQPGRSQVAEVRGTAQICTDRSLLESMRLRDRTPKAAIVIDVAHEALHDEPGLAAALWDPSRRVADGTMPRAANVWADHVRRNTDPGTGAKVARRLVSARAIAAGVAYDYRSNL